MEVRIKKCYKCKEIKSISDFYTAGLNKSGEKKYMSKCKSCSKALTRHRRNTPKYQHNRMLGNRTWLTDYKRTLSCSECDILFILCPEVCDFHHIDPATKETDVGTLLGSSRDKIMAEISKCVPICANCHRTLHIRERRRRQT